MLVCAVEHDRAGMSGCLKSTLGISAFAFRENRSRSLDETLFVLMTLGDDRAVRATYVAGALAHARDPVDA